MSELTEDQRERLAKVLLSDEPNMTEDDTALDMALVWPVVDSLAPVVAQLLTEQRERLEVERDRARTLAVALEQQLAVLTAERDALAASVDRVRRRHPLGDEDGGLLAPGLWCPTCGQERTNNGHGGCPDRNALLIPGEE